MGCLPRYVSSDRKSGFFLDPLEKVGETRIRGGFG
jgi:hypothetical protein